MYLHNAVTVATGTTLAFILSEMVFPKRLGIQVFNTALANYLIIQHLEKIQRVPGIQWKEKKDMDSRCQLSSDLYLSPELPGLVCYATGSTDLCLQNA